MKNLIILISSILILNSCSSNKIIFLNEQFKNELDSFLKDNKEEKNKILHIVIVDESDIFEDVINNNESEEDIYLNFYYSAPENCSGFYKSFEYNGKLILLYDFSERIKFSDLIDISNEAEKCNDTLLLKGHMDIPPMRTYYFDKNNRLIEILENRR